MKLIDITRPLRAGMPVWPGDTPAQFDFAATKAGGYSCNVGRLRISVHTGTHADAPYHYDDTGAKMDELPVDLFVGPARVVDARGQPAITVRLLAQFDFTATPRVLFRTDGWTELETFPSTWTLMTPDVPAWLAGRGVKLIGVDVPSVDEPTSRDLPVHHAINRARQVILENLDLRGVDAGVYELIALPLRIAGADGSPVRAVLGRE
jgi:arylformamidase